MFAGKKSAQIREILINESAWEEMTCLFAPSLNPALSGYERIKVLAEQTGGAVFSALAGGRYSTSNNVREPL